MMQDYQPGRARVPGDAPTTPFVGRPVAPPQRITTPLPEAAPVPPAWTAYAPPTYPTPTLTPVAPRRGRRSGVSGLLLTAMLILGLVAGGLGGGATALIFSHNTAAPVASDLAGAGAPTPVITHPDGSGVATDSGSLIHDLYAKAANSIVQVQVELGSGGRFADGGEGSGIVLDTGHVLTNNHVIDGAQTIHVILLDGTSINATVAGTAPQDDLAVLNVTLPADKVTPAVLGDSDAVEVGEEVVAIGNPFGLDHTVTAGIVSAVNRSWSDGNGPVHPMIQTDAPINPGNSGGALFNLQGQVIGVTTAIESPVRGSVGVGFAIPINRAKTLVPQLTQGSTVRRVWLGISGMQMDAELAKQLNVPVTKGVLTVQVIPNSPAAQAGVIGADPTTSSQVGDIVTAVDGQAVGSIAEITAYLQNKQVGDTVTLSIWRNGATQDVKVTLQAWPDQLPNQQGNTPSQPNQPSQPSQPNVPQGGNRAIRGWLGIQAMTVDSSLAQQLNLGVQQGALITAVTPNSPAAQAGLQGADPQSGQAGDVITAVDGTAVTNVQDLTTAISGHQPGDTVTLKIWRAGQSQDVKVTLADQSSGGSQSPFPGFPGFPGFPSNPAP